MIEDNSVGSGRADTASGMSAFDRVRVTVRPGTDVVARLPAVLLVTRVADTDEGDRALGAVLKLLEVLGATTAGAPGERMTRGLLVLIEDGAAPADLAMVAATDQGLTVVLAGAGAVTVSEPGLRLASADGRVLTRELDWPPAPLLLDLGADRAEPGDEAQRRALARPFDLRAGVVPGRAAVLSPPPAVTSLTGTVRLGQGALRPPPARETVAADGGDPPPRHDQILGVRPVGPPRPALPVLLADTHPESATALVRGYRCRDGHFNDPRALFCVACGIRMAESTSVLVEGPRPPLGLLVLDNGATFAVDDDYLLGREPDVDERVRAGQLRPLVLYDTTGAISRRHAEIRLDEWDVLLMDCGSANGTLVAERDAAVWSALVPGQPIRMLASMQVRIGDRSFVFESLQGAL